MKKFSFTKAYGLCLLLFAFFNATFVSSTYATHIMGSDITYFCTGPNQYQVSLTLFRDCAGILPLNTQTINFSSATCGVSSSLVLTQPSGPIDVTPICPGQTSACSGGTSAFGIEQYTYTGSLNLPAGCGADWVLSWKNCCRNYAITTLNSPGNQSMYVSASLDNTLSPCNNSPIFNNIPTPIVCVNQPVIYNHGVTDPDGDVLVFSLTSCKQDAGISVNYGAGFSSVVPLATAGGVTIDANTGELTFTPNQLQIGVICVLVEEYRGGIKIGETVRDMQFSVISCSNTTPVATGVNGNATDFDVDICVGQNYCFDILVSDADLDNVTAFWNNGIPAGTFTVSNNGTTNPTATFCWQPTANDVGTYYFTVTVEDDNCPLTASATYAFTVNVTNSTNSVTASPDQTICQGSSVGLSATASGATGYTWTPATGLNATNVANPIASPVVTTTYTVTADFANGCSAEDYVTVTVNPAPTVSVNPPVAYTCAGSALTLTANAPVGSTYNWSNGAGTSATATVSPTVTTTYTVSILDANNCPATADVTVNVSSPGTGQCNVIYVTPTGNGVGTQANPANLGDAINMANCSDLVIKMSTGTYNLDTAITSIQGNLTLEGGFNPAASFPWEKASTAGITTIHRSALNPVGPANQDRIAAFEISNASNFRFQDLTITTANATTPGTSNYGVHLSNCTDYVFARVQVLPGAAGNGAAGSLGAIGSNGANGLGGDPGDDDIQANAGDGGNGGGGGGSGGGIAGSAGLDPITNSTCCSNFPGQGGEQNSCCGAGNDGSNGSSSSNYSSGGAGGGGGSGGEANNRGGDGGRGALPNSGGTILNNGFGGLGDGGCSSQSGDPGTDGLNGATGATGSPGANGPGGGHAAGFWVPGPAAGTGGRGQGGVGGGGGGGGGGEGCGICCNDGAGSGGGGGGGGGEGGFGGTGGRGGGSSYGVYVHNNGGSTHFIDCNLNAGTAGAGGSGGPGGAGGNGGNGGNGNTYGSSSSINVGPGGDGGDGGDGGVGGVGGTGATGQSIAFHLGSGSTAPVTNVTSFALGSQPTIRMTNISCTNTAAFFIASVSSVWDLGAGATVSSPTGSIVASEYIITGRKDIIYGANVYRGFGNIIVDQNLVPQSATTAPMVASQYTICQGSSVDFAALNGAPGYVYHWDLDGGAAPGTYAGTSYETLNGITFNTPGTYYIELQYETDCCGLTSPDSIALVVEPQPVIAMNDTSFCAQTGGVVLSASGGSDYIWAPATGLSTNSGATVIANPTSTTTYSITAFNATGNCYANDVFTVTVNDINLGVSTAAQNCLPDGQASVFATGGSGVYSYAWNTNPIQTSATATGLQAGTYQVTVTDLVTGCLQATTAAVGNSPSTISALVSANNAVTCNGATDGSATVSVSGGSGSYAYAWSPIGGNGATSTAVPSGTYTVNITDNITSCTTSEVITIVEPAPINIGLLDSVNSDCNNLGEMVANASGGNGPFSYTWNTTPISTTNSVDSLLPGSYTVTVVDQDGCTENRTVTVPGPESPVLLNLDSLHDASGCSVPDGYIKVSANGSNGNISYLWSDGQVGDSAFNLVPGAYSVTATGSNGCTDVMVFDLEGCVLSIASLEFEARAKLMQIDLDWKTSQEMENSGFWLERSLEGEFFNSLAWVPSLSVSGAGARYQVEDSDVLPNQEYFYRLKQVSLNGQVAFSQIRSAKILLDNPLEVLAVYPVPTTDKVFVEIMALEDQSVKLILTNTLGQRVKNLNLSVKAGRHIQELPLGDLSVGIYFLQMQTNGLFLGEFKLMKI